MGVNYCDDFPIFITTVIMPLLEINRLLRLHLYSCLRIEFFLVSIYLSYPCERVDCYNDIFFYVFNSIDPSVMLAFAMNLLR